MPEISGKFRNHNHLFSVLIIGLTKLIKNITKFVKCLRFTNFVRLLINFVRPIILTVFTVPTT